VKAIKTVLESEHQSVVQLSYVFNAVLQRTGQRWHNFQDRARNVPPLNNGVICMKKEIEI